MMLLTLVFYLKRHERLFIGLYEIQKQPMNTFKMFYQKCRLCNFYQPFFFLLLSRKASFLSKTLSKTFSRPIMAKKLKFWTKIIRPFAAFLI